MRTYIVDRISTTAKAFFVEANSAKEAENKLRKADFGDQMHKSIERASFRDMEDNVFAQCDGETV